MKYLGGFAILLGTLIVIGACSLDQPDILTGIAGLILCAAGQGTGPVHVHQIRYYGGIGRRPPSGATGHGRHARGGCGFLDHRSIFATHAETPRCRPLHHARRIQSL